MLLALVIVAVVTEDVSANSEGPILGFTGAPGEIGGDGANCTYGPGLGCHESFAANSGPGFVTIDAPESYEPGMTYAIQVDVSQPGQLRWGFQLTVLEDALDQPAGTLDPTDTFTKTQEIPPRQYITHNNLGGGTAPGKANENSWTFEWIAPDTDVGPVTFYAAGNAANNDGLSSGDYIYTTIATVAVPEPSALAAGLLALSITATLARRKDRPRAGGA